MKDAIKRRHTMLKKECRKALAAKEQLAALDGELQGLILDARSALAADPHALRLEIEAINREAEEERRELERLTNSDVDAWRVRLKELESSYYKRAGKRLTALKIE